MTVSPTARLKERMSGGGTHEPCGCAGFIGKPNPPPLRRAGPPPPTSNQCPKGYAIRPLPQVGPPQILPTRTIYSYVSVLVPRCPATTCALICSALLCLTACAACAPPQAAAGVAVNLTFASPKFLEDLKSFLPVTTRTHAWCLVCPGAGGV